jgi:ribosomal-protein-alanine N-acetyltransferase
MVQTRRDGAGRDGPRPPGGPADDLVVHLVPMRRRHLRAVLRIESQVYPRPWSLSLFVSELALRTSRAYWVARVDGVVVGYCGLMVAVDDGHVTTLAVDPAWHRRTIGTRLLLALAREAIRRGATSLTLEVRVGNTGAQELYRRFGFRPAGVRKNYYVETNEDALVMWADDVDTAEYTARLDALERTIPGITLVEEARPW